jgi:hypothetical protein
VAFHPQICIDNSARRACGRRIICTLISHCLPLCLARSIHARASVVCVLNGQKKRQQTLLSRSANSAALARARNKRSRLAAKMPAALALSESSKMHSCFLINRLISTSSRVRKKRPHTYMRPVGLKALAVALGVKSSARDKAIKR